MTTNDMKMNNIPRRIFLQVGDLEDSNIDFAELRDVTWSADRIYDTDIEYILKPSKAKKSIAQMAKEAKGGSMSCAKCSERMTCTFIDREMCRNAFVEGFVKGNKQARKG